jgi:hypothetical protein
MGFVESGGKTSALQSVSNATCKLRPEVVWSLGIACFLMPLSALLLILRVVQA